jgi:NADPH:quinone reductase-like Zn-dependent oxidoreductase
VECRGTATDLWTDCEAFSQTERNRVGLGMKPGKSTFRLNKVKIELRMNVLVTGGAGYIGSHAAKYLTQAGLRPVVIDDLQRGHREAVKWGPLIEADFGNIQCGRKHI